ncbi:MAG: fimbria/pilus outer membrane usher protein [Gammaproteobacteria bacterium]
MGPVLLCLLFAVMAATGETAPKLDSLATSFKLSDIEERLLAIQVNGRDLKQTAQLLQSDGALYVDVVDLRDWRFRIPEEAVASSYGNRSYYSFEALGLSYSIDEARQLLMIEAPPQAFLPIRISGSALMFSKPDPSTLGGFVNYDLFAQSSSQGTSVDSLFEVGAFNGWGLGVGSFLVRDLGDASRVIRLDTTWTLDRPEQLASLRLGDAVANAGAWGRSLRFGGLQWATNFQTQPGFITFPLPNIEGEAVLPSTVDVFIDHHRLFSDQVQSGPFVIDNVAAITGLREMRLIVRDLLGRERTISQPYYASPRLLKPNLHEFSYEFGSIRENYGLNGNDYGRWFGAGTHRFGFNNVSTGEMRAELLQRHQTIGIGGVWLWPLLGVFDVAAVGSHERGKFGSLLAVGIERQTSMFSFGGRVQFADRHFRQLGLAPTRPAPRLSSSSHLGLSTGFGNLSLTHFYQNYRDQSPVNLLNANYNLTLGKDWFLNVSAFGDLNGGDDNGVALVLSHSFGNRSNASLALNHRNGSEGALLRVQRNLPPGSGLGYRMAAGYETTERLEAGLSLQNDYGTYHADFARYRQHNYLRGSVSGGVAIMGGELFASRRINSSFAVVQVPDYAGVRVYAENQPVATTDAEGYALIPNLRPYQQNHIRIEQADLPLDAQIDTLTINASPYFRSGFLLKFPVRRSRGAVFKIILDNGQPLPAGATVQIIGQTQTFPVALQGTAYVTGLAVNNELRARWQNQSCRFTLSFPETEDPLPDLGFVKCHGVVP